MDYRILGPLELSDGDRPIALGRAKQRALLAILLLHANEIVSIDRLIDDLWDEDPPPTSENTVHVYVSRLRRSLSSDGDPGTDILVTKPPGYILHVRPGELDADRFRDLFAEGRGALLRGEPRLAREHLGKALALWRGEPLADLAFESFAQLEIERLRELRVQATEARIEADLALGQDEELIAELRSLVSQTPAREKLWQHLIVALYRSGRQAEALETFREAADSFAEELGIDPGPGLQDLHRRVLHQDPSLAPKREVAIDLPPTLSSLVGRVDEIASVSQLLRGGVRVVTLTGPGGAGKTRLSIETARTLADAFPDGIVFVDLAPVRLAELVPSSVAASLRLEETDARPSEDVLIDALQGRRVLLVLDNFEHVIGAVPFVISLIAATDGPSLLITSRTELHVGGGRTVIVKPLPLPSDSSNDAVESDAVRLFIERARSVNPDLTLDDRVLGLVVEICRHLDGLPLAIELAAARCKLFSPPEILDRLRSRPTLSGDDLSKGDGRHDSLNAVVHWSYELLASDEQAAFGNLSVFAGGWTLEAFMAVCELAGREGDALRLLGSLLDKSLVYRVPTRQRGRFGMLETIRAFAADRLEASAAGERLQVRHGDHFLAVAEDEELALLEGKQHDWIERVGEDQGNFRAAIDRALDTGRLQVAGRLVAALGQYWCTTGQLTEGTRWVEATLERAAELEAMVLGRVLDTGGRIRYRQSEFDASAKMHEHALEVARDARDDAGIAAALTGIGSVAFVQGRQENAERAYREALALGRAAGDRWRTQSALVGLAGVHYARDDLDGAAKLLEESLDISRQNGDDYGAGVELTNLAEIALAQGAFELATARGQEAVEILRRFGGRSQLANALLKQGLALLSASPGIAEPILAEALSIAMETGDRWVVADALEGFALLRSSTGSSEVAASLYGSTYALKLELGVTIEPTGSEDRYASDIASLRHRLADDFIISWNEGFHSPIRDAIDMAVNPERASSGTEAAAPDVPERRPE